jgi:hypothetical protein
MKKLIKGVIIIIVVVAVIALALSLMKSKKEDSSALQSTTGATAGVLPGTQGENSEALTVSDQFLRLLLSMQNIELDQSIFVDPAFTSLEDFSVNIIPRNNEGRVNPFAPVGRDTASTSVSPQAGNVVSPGNTSTNSTQ